MKLTVDVPEHMLEHLRTYAAHKFFDTSEYAMGRALLVALVGDLDRMCLTSQEEVVAGVLSRPVIDVAPLLPQTVQQLQPTTIQTPVVLNGDKRVPQGKQKTEVYLITDPKELQIPRDQHGEEVSFTWLVWGWCLSSSLNLVTIEGGGRKWHSFEPRSVYNGLVDRKKIQVKDPTLYNALDRLVKLQWLVEPKTKVFSLTEVAKKWVLDRKNQEYLIEHGFLDPVS